jgi:hypothetical protein
VAPGSEQNQGYAKNGQDKDEAGVRLIQQDEAAIKERAPEQNEKGRASKRYLDLIIDLLDAPDLALTCSV